jgi:hypothetical protein
MIREQTLRARQKLVSKLPVSGELLRGSLLERTVRHTKDCPKCARGEGQPFDLVWDAALLSGGIDFEAMAGWCVVTTIPPPIAALMQTSRSTSSGAHHGTCR